ncbi:MAG: hypothetical protein ABIT08_12705 [Bacteroidia bacterium]
MTDFAEVDNSLASLCTFKQERAVKSRELAASKGFTLKQARYDEGYFNYLELLN